MTSSVTEKLLMWCVRIGIWMLLLTPIIVAPTWFFPYITGKNFFFRIITEVTFGFWLALIVVGPRFRPRRGFVLWSLGAFLGILTLTTIFGADPYNSFWSNYERMEGFVTYVHLAALFLMASSVFRTVDDWRLTLHISVGVSILIAGYGLLELFSIVQILGSAAGESGIGIFSRLGNSIYLAAYLLFHFFILGFLFFTTKNILWRAVYAAVGIFEFYIFIHTGTRGAFIGLMLGLVASLLALVIFSLRDNKKLALSMGALLLAGAAVVAGFFMVRDSVFVRQYPLLERFSDIRLTSATATSRFMIWGIAWEAFKERPVLGWGPGNFIIPYAKYYNPNLFGNEPWFDRVHNMHFEWLVAGGIAGFLAYLFVVCSSIAVLWRLWRRRILSAAAAAVLVGFLVAYLGQNTFVFDTVISYLFIIVLFALLQSLDTASTAEKNTRSLMPSNQAFFLAPAFVVLGIILAATIHIKPMRVAGGIIDMLNSVSQGRTIVDLTGQLDNLVIQGTFGTSETRERFADFLFSAVRQQSKVSASDLQFLLTRGIDEIRKESERHPQNAKTSITLAKLLQLRFAVTGSTADRDESIALYQKIVQQAPGYPSAYIGLAEVYLTAGDAKQAAITMDTMYQQITRPTPFVYTVLSVSVLAGEYAKAADQAERYIALGNTPAYPQKSYFDSTDIDSVLNRVRSTEHTADTERFLEVIFNYQKASPLLFITLAEVKAELGKFSEARHIALELLERDKSYQSKVEEFLSLLPKE
ncbi:MAG: Uncharacterized protein G01um101429_489 [Parcubacteria group bacterium Gr01-1014_29]|nr:MAG: Uncharacterized protein G01um101429_489 [Parcubacteria group bacterium Gr01-1014_29]